MTAQGRVGYSGRTNELALERAGELARETADLYVDLSEIDRKCGDLLAATGRLLKSQELGECPGLPKTTIGGSNAK